MFYPKRFLNLLRQYFLHNYTALILGLLVTFGVSFLIFTGMQYLGSNNQSNSNEFFIMFIFGYAILGALYISKAFSPFRNKEKTLAYLMVPASTLEKFLVELIFHPLLFLLAFPLLYLIAFQLSSAFTALVVANFVSFDLLGHVNEQLVSQNVSVKNGVRTVTSEVHFGILVAAIGFTLAMVFFLGAASFKKYAMLKSLLGLAAYIGLCVWLFYFLIAKLEWGEYDLTDSYLTPFPKGGGIGQSGINFFSYWIFCWGLLVSVVSYFKLREKEV